MNLADLQTGEKALIVKVKGYGSFRKRMLEMGFVRGQMVELVKQAPFHGPAEYSVMGYHISLRPTEAKLVEVVTLENAHTVPVNKFEGIVDTEKLKLTANEQGKSVSVAFVGNPNCGKTSLFNFVSGAKEHVGNYSGVTVEAKYNTYAQDNYSFNLIDLPGTYSLTAYTPEELYVRKYIFHNNPDIVVNVIDASNLERNLYLTTQLIDMDIKVVIALNMYDDLESSGSHLEIKKLAKLLGIPIIPTVAIKGKGVSKLFSKVIDVYENQDPIVRHIHINYGNEVEQSIKNIRRYISDEPSIMAKISPRFLAVKLLEQDSHAIRFVSKHSKHKNILKNSYKEVDRIERIIGDGSESVITDAKYGFIDGALKETLKTGESKRWLHTNNIDKVLTHRIFGGPIFVFFMFIMFFATFKLGSYPMDWIDAGIQFVNSLLKSNLPQGMLSDLITDGIVSGLGGVLVFLPNIVILFLFISFMEDTGYMARAAFMMDKLMHKIGLHGRSFIPLIMGFGCNVPAILSTRTIRNKSDRLLTMLIIPFMSCSARLPIYILFVGAFFPNSPTLVLIGLYLLGIGFAILTARILNKTKFKSKDAPFVMELPPYRLPSAKSTFKHMWDMSAQYLQKIGGVILIAVIIIWALGYFPQEVDYTQDYQTKIDKLEQQISKSTANEVENVQNEIYVIKEQMNGEQLANSYLGKIGRFVEPVIKPLGFDWRMGIALISGIVAKEIVVSTISVIMPTDDNNGVDGSSLTHTLQTVRYDSGKRFGDLLFSPLVALSFLIFILIYSPCVGVIGAIAKESGRWRWSLLMVGYTTGLAWVMSFLVYQIGSLL